ncbi:alanine--tRNA ligase [Candidatus Puniceispirillum sp.]|uniref:alanine--tRNA ligase n=1 Tax=Candidatus Puniceispirillum sp. TaxID=2026719 RepID=UPI001EB4BE20|nr:alanine--tRNA ligase [Candidatus Puniceispirillum sp.]
MASVNDIRATFLDYFQTNGHQVVDSSPLVPQNDPTLMFTNAGMVQFKNLFTGLETRDYERAVTSQKCVRAGGKHNDLENVGYTARHHTFFEMLGNFSFGDYFKEHAIELAWNLITREYGLDASKLLVTVYHEDEEAADLWKKIARLGDDRIIRIATSDNFWAMGDTGPCGPCSEIFYDHGDHIPGGPPGSPDEDGDRFIEIWNLVFMQFEQTVSERINLPKPSIDTGMGLERIAAVLQGKHDNYDIDLMRTLIEASADAANVAADGDHNVSHRVVADHLRASSFLIADGVLPSNEGRGYVLRRIMRRAMRHLHQMECQDPTMWRLVPALVAEMGGHYPELGRAQALISETLKLEEGRFKETLGRGLRILNDEVAGKAAGGVLDGKTAFKLYDTFGFPLDLTQDFMRGYEWDVDLDGFNTAMEAQKAAARKAWSGSGDAATETVWLDLGQQLGATEFLGYTTDTAEGQVTALVRDGAPIDSAASGEDVQIITNQTPFYAESGGQVGDIGVISWADGTADVTDTFKTPMGMFVHRAHVTKGTLEVGCDVRLDINATRRLRLRSNHSATHLLHEALREVLGEHVAQKGSMVGPDRLRFDFSHPKAMSDDELARVQAIVNSRVQMNSDVSTRIMTPEAAIELGALALFGEKYGDEVRVVQMGGETDVKGRTAWSVELCGGTHVNRTGDISILKIIGESAVAGGVRRIEAVTQAGAVEWIEHREQILSQTAELLKIAPEQLADRVAKLLEDNKRAERDITLMRRKLAAGGEAGGGGSEQINGINFVGRLLEDTPARELKSMADEMKQGLDNAVICLVATDSGKASIVVAVTDDLVATKSAVDLVRVGSAALGGGGGGGRPDMAQAGGPNADDADAALKAVAAAL